MSSLGRLPYCATSPPSDKPFSFRNADLARRIGGPASSIAWRALREMHSGGGDGAIGIWVAWGPREGVGRRAITHPIGRPTCSSGPGLPRMATKGVESCPSGAVPTLDQIGPYRFSFFSNDGLELPHAPVQRDHALAKFWLRPVALASTVVSPSSARIPRAAAKLRAPR